MGILNIIFNQKDITEKDIKAPAVNSNYQKLSDNDNRKAECPYCHKALKKIPGSKTKCPHCGHFIYVRTKPTNGQRILIKEDQIEQIEQEWQDYFIVRDFKERIKSQCGSGFNKKYSAIKDELTKKFGLEPLEEDILWGLSNHLLLGLMKKGDWQEMKTIYFAQASFLHDDGQDCMKVLGEAHKCDLRDYARSKLIRKVEIITCGESSCPSCRKLSGKIFTIERALNEMPLPEKDCSSEPNLKSKQGWCRCCYGPVVD